MATKAPVDAKHYDANHEDDGRMADRSCTDIICAIIFFIFLGGMGYITNFALANGNPKRLTHGYNFNGSLCGVDPGFENRSMLYYCSSTTIKGIPTELNLKAPVCVSACPTNNREIMHCLEQTSAVPAVSLSGAGTAIGQTVVLSQSLVDTYSYATLPVMGLYCMPDLVKLNAMAAAEGVPLPMGLRDSLFNSSGPIGKYSQKAQQYAGSLKRCWPLLCGTLLFTVITSYIFLFLLKCFAKPLIYLVLIFLFLFFFGIAGFFLGGEMLPRPDIHSANNSTVIANATVSARRLVGNTTANSTITMSTPQVTTAGAGWEVPQHLRFNTSGLVDNIAQVYNSINTSGWEVPQLSYAEACANVPEQCALWEQRWEQYGGRKNWEDVNPYYNEHLTMAQAKLCTQVTGGIFAVLGFIFLILLCCAHESIAMSIGCVEAAVECIWAIPCMIFMPAVEVAVKVFMYAFLLYGLGYLLSAGKLDNKTILNVGGKEINGLRRHFTYTDEEKVYVGYYVFGLFWLLEMANAMGSFAFSYAVVDWYYTPKDANGYKAHHWFSLAKAYVYAWTYHLGTLAMGSFLIALLRFLRLIMTFIERYAKSQGNPVAACIARCLICCLTCFKKFVEQINKNAYIDVAINSSNFCTAAADSLAFMVKQAPAITILTGACTIFSFAGCALLSSLTGFVTYELVTSQPRWTAEDSPHHIASPGFVAAVAAFGAIFVSASFMVVFDHTADTLLYTYCWNKSKAHNTVAKYAPECLIGAAGKKGLLEDQAGAENGYEPLTKAAPGSNGQAQSAPAKGGFWSSMCGSQKETDPLVPKQ